MLKLTTRASLEATTDLVSAAQEACDAYQAVLAAGESCAEISQIVDNIAFARDIIKAHGAKWYIENCDPENTFGAALGLVEKELTVKAATEGLGEWLKNAWDKIVEWWNKLADWVKGLFKKDVQKEVTQNVEVAKTDIKKAVEAIKKNPAKKAELPKKEVKVTASRKIGRLFGRLKARFSKSAAKEDLEGSISTHGWDGHFPTVKGFKLFAEFIPQLERAVVQIYAEAKSCLSMVESIKTEDSCKTVGEKLQTTLDLVLKNSQAHQLIDHFGPELEKACLESENKDTVTFAEIGIHNENDAQMAIDELCKCQNLANTFSGTVAKTTDDFAEYGKKIVTDLCNRLRSSGASEEVIKLQTDGIRDIAKASRDATELTAIISEMIIAMSEIAKEIASSLNKAAA